MPHSTEFLNGSLKILQPEKGYRFSVEAPILADFVKCSKNDKLLEIGTGCGIISLIILKKRNFKHIWAVEIQSSLAKLALENVSQNGGKEKISIVIGDIRKYNKLKLPYPFDVIFSNPPYRKIGSGRLNPNTQKALARHELYLNVEELFAIVRKLLKKDGSFFLVHLGERTEEIKSAAANAGIYLRCLKPVFSFPSSPTPKLTLTEWKFEESQKEILPPLIIYDKENIYSEEFIRIISP